MTVLRTMAASILGLSLGLSAMAGPAAASKSADYAACRTAIASVAGVQEDDYRFKVGKVRRSGGASLIAFEVIAKRGVDGADYTASCTVRRGEVLEADATIDA